MTSYNFITKTLLLLLCILQIKFKLLTVSPVLLRLPESARLRSSSYMLFQLDFFVSFCLRHYYSYSIILLNSKFTDTNYSTSAAVYAINLNKVLQPWYELLFMDCGRSEHVGEPIPKVPRFVSSRKDCPSLHESHSNADTDTLK